MQIRASAMIISCIKRATRYTDINRRDFVSCITNYCKTRVRNPSADLTFQTKNAIYCGTPKATLFVRYPTDGRDFFGVIYFCERTRRLSVDAFGGWAGFNFFQSQQRVSGLKRVVAIIILSAGYILIRRRPSHRAPRPRRGWTGPLLWIR